MRKFILGVILLALLGAGGFYLRGRAVPPPPAAAELPVPVIAGHVERRDVPIYLTGIGTVSAYNTVSIRSRVDGQIDKVLFHEGQNVKAGDVLALIDPRPLRASLKQLEANRLRDIAQLANAKADLDRFQALSAKEFASRQSVDTQKSQVAQFEAQIASDEALIEGAKVQLDYCTITSPIDGRTGIRGVDAGNIVHASDLTAIVMVTQLQPISVIFTLSADHLPEISRGQERAPLKVLAYAKDNVTPLAEGQLELADNQIDAQTGTVKLKATFANADHALWPGQFVNARLLVTIRSGGLIVPATVVQHGPNSAYAWVIKPDGTAEMRPITVAQIQDGAALIDQGLAAGETVVIDGQYKLQPGSKVEIQTRPAPNPGPA